MGRTLLSLGEAAAALGVPEVTARRWARQGKLPAHVVDGHPRIYREELEAWAKIHRMAIEEAAERVTRHPVADTTLLGAMQRGGVHFHVKGRDAGEALRSAVAVAPLAAGVNRDALFERILEREQLTSTAMGSGVAVPHPRTPAFDFVAEAMVVTCFLDQPVDFHALDGRPVEVLFLLLNPSTAVHLRVLAQLGHLLRSEGFLEFLPGCESADALFERAAEIAPGS